MKKLFALTLALVMVFALCAVAFADRDLQAEYDYEMNQARYITSRGPAWEYDGLMKYEHYWFQVAWTFEKMCKPISEAANGVYNKYGELMPGAGSGEEIVDNLRSLREALVPVVEDPESVCWYIWGENMAEAEDAADYDYSFKFDTEGFKPFLVPYMLDDQSTVKGNIVVVAGGGFNQRCHDYEAYATALEFNAIGYNAFVLQRRVAPSTKLDAYLDLQRAVRYIKFFAEEKGIGASEHIGTIGFSGGGATICGQLDQCFGDITPDAFYPAYVCDEIDAVNSDYEAAMLFYGAIQDGEGNFSANENMPALFLCVGAEDSDSLVESTTKLFLEARKNGWNPELYIAAGAPHGFGVIGVRAFTDQGTLTAAQAMGLVETWLGVQFGHVENHWEFTDYKLG